MKPQSSASLGLACFVGGFTEPKRASSGSAIKDQASLPQVGSRTASSRAARIAQAPREKPRRPHSHSMPVDQHAERNNRLMEDQKFAALRRANEVRVAQARLRAQIRATGDREALVPILRETPECARSMSVGRFLRSAAGVGDKKAAGIVRRTYVSESRRLGTLTEHERRELIRAVRS